MAKLSSKMGGLRIYLAGQLRNLALTKDLGPGLSNDTICLDPLFIQQISVTHPTTQDTVLDIVDPRTNTCDVAVLMELTV